MNLRERFEEETGQRYPEYTVLAPKYLVMYADWLEKQLTPQPGPPPKDGRRYPCWYGHLFIACKYEDEWEWDDPSLYGEPTAHLSFPLDSLTQPEKP